MKTKRTIQDINEVSVVEAGIKYFLAAGAFDYITDDFIGTAKSYHMGFISAEEFHIEISNGIYTVATGMAYEDSALYKKVSQLLYEIATMALIISADMSRTSEDIRSEILAKLY